MGKPGAILLGGASALEILAEDGGSELGDEKKKRVERGSQAELGDSG